MVTLVGLCSSTFQYKRDNGGLCALLQGPQNSWRAARLPMGGRNLHVIYFQVERESSWPQFLFPQLSIFETWTFSPPRSYISLARHKHKEKRKAHSFSLYPSLSFSFSINQPMTQSVHQSIDQIFVHQLYIFISKAHNLSLELSKFSRCQKQERNNNQINNAD